jgi:hypothetical protein
MPTSQYDVNINLKTTDKTSPAAKKAGGAVGMLGKAATVAAAAMVALKVAQEAIKFAKFGGEVQRASDSLQFLAAGAEQSADRIVASMQSASGHTIDRMSAMSAANKALLLGVAKTPQEFANLTKQAVLLGRAMGQDAASSIDDFIVAAGRQSKQIADNLGLMVSVEVANEKYAARLGTTADQLTDLQKKEAFRNEMLAQAAEKTKALEGQTGGLATQGEQLNAEWKDLTANAAQVWAKFVEGTGIVTALTDFLWGLNRVLKVLFKDTLKSTQREMAETTKRTDEQREAWLSFADVTRDTADEVVKAQEKMTLAAQTSAEKRIDLQVEEAKAALKTQLASGGVMSMQDMFAQARSLAKFGGFSSDEVNAWLQSQNARRNTALRAQRDAQASLQRARELQRLTSRPGYVFNQTVNTNASQANIMRDFALAQALAR